MNLYVLTSFWIQCYCLIVFRVGAFFAHLFRKSYGYRISIGNDSNQLDSTKLIVNLINWLTKTIFFPLLSFLCKRKICCKWSTNGLIEPGERKKINNYEFSEWTKWSETKINRRCFMPTHNHSFVKKIIFSLFIIDVHVYQHVILATENKLHTYTPYAPFYSNNNDLNNIQRFTHLINSLSLFGCYWCNFCFIFRQGSVWKCVEKWKKKQNHENNKHVGRTGDNTYIMETGNTARN